VTIPRGATHFMPGAYNTDGVYMRRTFDFFSVDSGNSYYRWDVWHQGEWRRDQSEFCDRFGLLQKLPEIPLVIPSLYPEK